MTETVPPVVGTPPAVDVPLRLVGTPQPARPAACTEPVVLLDAAGRPSGTRPKSEVHHAGTPLRLGPWAIAAAAAALVLVVAVGAVTFARRGDDGGGSVVASAELEPLPDEPTGSAAPVRAELVDDEGQLQLDLSISDLPATDGYFEVWLIDTNVEGMVSLGPARDDGRYAVPPDVDPGRFPIVDVSIEPPDGDPTHSGVSVLRGTLA